MRLPSKKDYPKKVRLGGTEYKIVFKRMKHNSGLTDASKQTIFIDPDQDDFSMFSTLIHELIHFIEFEYPMKIKHKQVYKFEKAIMQLIVDNF